MHSPCKGLCVWIPERYCAQGCGHYAFKTTTTTNWKCPESALSGPHIPPRVTVFWYESFQDPPKEKFSKIVPLKPPDPWKYNLSKITLLSKAASTQPLRSSSLTRVWNFSKISPFEDYYSLLKWQLFKSSHFQTTHSLIDNFAKSVIQDHLCS